MIVFLTLKIFSIYNSNNNKKISTMIDLKLQDWLVNLPLQEIKQWNLKGIIITIQIFLRVIMILRKFRSKK